MLYSTAVLSFQPQPALIAASNGSKQIELGALRRCVNLLSGCGRDMSGDEACEAERWPDQIPCVRLQTAAMQPDVPGLAAPVGQVIKTLDGAN